MIYKSWLKNYTLQFWLVSIFVLTAIIPGVVMVILMLYIQPVAELQINMLVIGSFLAAIVIGFGFYFFISQRIYAHLHAYSDYLQEKSFGRGPTCFPIEKLILPQDIFLFLLKNEQYLHHLAMQQQRAKQDATLLQKQLLEQGEQFQQCQQDLQALKTSEVVIHATNRMQFDQLLKKELARAAEHSQSMVLLLIDLDNLQYINEHYGREVGDVVLREVLQLLQGAIINQEKIARYGGDEFVVLMHADQKQARERAEYVGVQIATFSFRHQQQSFNVSASMGLVYCDKKTDNLNTLSKKIEETFFRAKKSGGQRLVESRG